MLYEKKVFLNKTYGQFVYMLHGKVVNESIYITYLKKRYMNISPIGHNISFTELQNPPYSFPLGFIFTWGIFITT